MMKKALTAVFSVLVVVALIGVSLVGPAEADPPHLSDNRLAQTPIALAADICTSILGPFKEALDFFDLDVCPDMTGRVLAKPHIWNVFADDNWDANHPPQFSKAAINDLTRKIIDTTPGNNYLGKAGQYGVGAATFDGSSENNGCTGAPTGTTNQLSIDLWITCEVQAPGTGVPYPDTNSLYVVFLPSDVDINNGPLGGTCDKFNAYHLQSMALTVELVFGIPPFEATFQSYPYAIIPLKCAMDSNGVLQLDKLTKLMTHEIVEAVTDPISLGGWVDNTTFNFSLDFLKEGEAADICQPGIGPAPDARVRRLDNGIRVEPYWSNADTTCVPLLHTLTLNTTGLPAGVVGQAFVTSQAIFNDPFGHTADLPKNYDMVDQVHAAWTFVTPIAGGAGVRYVTGSSGSGGPIVINGDITSTATYGTEYQLTVNTNPSSVQSLATLLTPSEWVSAGATVNINTNDFIPSGPDRYRFRFWTGASTDIFTATTVLMDAPKTATANYALQHLVTFDETGIPTGVPWTVRVRNVDHSGPYSEWFDEFSLVSFSFQDPVPALTAGTRYTLVGTSTTTPLEVTTTGSVTATYKTQELLTVHTAGLPSPNLTTITNSATVLGTANDATPLATWLDDGTSLSLAADANVNGVDGTQYFAQAFSPTPPATLNAPFETTMTYKTVAQLISDALENGGLTGPTASGVGKALRQQFAAVEADMGAKRYAAALGDLTAFVDLVKASCCTPTKGKALTPPTAKMLQLDAMLVYHSALCLGSSSGQLSAKQRQDSYSYYTAIVTSLGGTVLPPCP
jgi:hypothetical protein